MHSHRIVMSSAFAIAAVPALLSLTGCAGQERPERTVQVSNPGYQLDQLFTDPNGCTVYRFYDHGEWRYYVVGPNGAQMLPTTRTVTETETTAGFIACDTSGGDKK